MNPSSPLVSQLLFDAHVPSADALRAIEAHPRFSAAMRLIAAGAVAQFCGNRILNMLVTDRARFLIGVFAIHLHDMSRPGDPRSGLTLSRIKAICVEQKICSGGRAEAMLILMRMFGYLASARSGEDRRLHRLSRRRSWSRGTANVSPSRSRRSRTCCRRAQRRSPSFALPIS